MLSQSLLSSADFSSNDLAVTRWSTNKEGRWSLHQTMQRTFSSQMTTELLISCILIRYKRTRWFYTLMGFVYFEQLYIYCPNSFLNYFSEPFEIIRQGGWIFKEAGRNENLKLIIYGLNFFAADWKKRRFFRLLTVCSVCSLLLQRKFFFWHYLLFINVNRQSHIYMSKVLMITIWFFISHFLSVTYCAPS